MAILTTCPHCRRPAKVPQDAAGKTVRCTGCTATFAVRLGSGELTIEWGPAGAGRKVPLQPDETITIGRAKDNTVTLPGPLVSRCHATLTWNDSEWCLRDADSTNGTFVNGQRIKDIGLTDGSRIVIGDFALRLAVVTSGPSDLDTALDAMAVEEAKSGVRAVVDVRDGYDAAADSRVDTAWGHPSLPESEDEEEGAAARRRGLLERWPVVLALAICVIVVVALLIAFRI